MSPPAEPPPAQPPPAGPPPSGSDGPGPRSGGPVRPLRAAAALVGAQALALAGIAVFFLVETVVATSDDVVRALVAAGLAAAAAAGLALVTRGLLRRRRWARAPALVTNVLVLPVAWDLLRSERWYVGAGLAVWAAAVLVLLFTPSTDAALEE